MPQVGDDHYLLPQHPGEVDRLDLQHYALRTALGSNHQSPLDSPARVLDVGAGTGQWGWDLAKEFRDAMVVGVDRTAGKPGPPAHYHPVRADVLQGLPFREDSFDFVHQRFLFLGIPLNGWPALVRDLVRVTRPGGWVELVEPQVGILENAGPAINRMMELTLGSAASMGLDTTGAVYDSLDEYLRQSGLTGVERKEVSLPIGEWGGVVGSFMGTDFRVTFTRVLEARTTVNKEELRTILHEVQTEYETRHVRYHVAVASGQKR